ALTFALALFSAAQLFGQTSWTTKAPLLAPRSSTAAATLNNTLYVVGGFTTAGEKSVLRYNEGLNSWITVNPMNSIHWNYAVGVARGILYAVGGNDSVSSFTDLVEGFDGTTWTIVTHTPIVRAFHAVASLNGKLYVIGGQTLTAYTTVTDVYNPSQGWST